MSILKCILAAALGAVVFVSFLGCVSDSEVVMVKRDLNTRMDSLEARVDNMEKGGGGGTQKEIEQLQARQVEMFNNIEELRSHTQDLTGMLEGRMVKMQREIGRQPAAPPEDLTQLREELNKVRERVDLLEQNLASGKPVVTPPPAPMAGTGTTTPATLHPTPTTVAAKPPVAPPAPPKPVVQDADSLYNEAHRLYSEGKYEEAQRIFEEFVAKYPTNPNTDNAQFWVGECFFKRGDYGKAILEYQKVVEKYGKGNKVPDALLKQALAFKALGDKTSAKLLLKKVISQYGDSPSAKLAETELKKF